MFRVNSTLHLSAVLLASFVLAEAPARADMLALPSPSGTFSGNVRGYWFTAPVDFTITGLGVPTDASTGPQSIEIVRLNSIPPAYSSVTNDFTSLFRVVDDPSLDLIPVDIDVATGDIIGILGYRGSTNSYGAGGFVSSIFDNPVTLLRLGMQFSLQSTPARDLWTEDASISRVNMEFGPTGFTAIPEPSTYLAGLAALGMIAAFRRKRVG